MDVSPFPYQGPLEPSQVTARDDLIADLTQRVTERRVTALLGPRRYGKTSVLRRVAADIEAAGASVLWLDLYEVSSMADLAVRLDEGLSKIEGAAAHPLRQLAAGASLNLGLVRLDLRAPASKRPEPVGLVHSQLDIITELAQRTPLLVIFDEFSSIQRIDGAAGLLRTHLQHHYQTLGLLFAGSEPSMMATMFTDQAEPFYAQADLINIGPFSPADVITIVQAGFDSTDRKPGPLAERIADFAQGHPQRTMQLADTAWRLVPAGGSATTETWELTVANIRGAVNNGLERLYSSLRSGEKDVLRVIASGGSIFGSAASLLDLSTGSAQHARNQMLDNGHLRKEDKRLVIVDPLFADWLRQRVPL